VRVALAALTLLAFGGEAATVRSASVAAGATGPEERAHHPELVWLEAGAFDPLRDGGRPAEAILGGEVALRHAPATLWLVQLNAAVTSEHRLALADAGAEILGYVPHRTFVVRPRDPASVAALRALGFVRWVGVFPPSAKASGALLERIRAQPLDGAPIELDVGVFAPEDPAALAAAAQERFEGIEVLFVRSAAPRRMVLRVPAGLVRTVVGALVRDPGISFVEVRERLEPNNDNIVWIGQSYDRTHGPAEALAPDPKTYALSGTLWARGLTGTGQIVAVADTGLQHDMCFFHDPQVPVVLQTVLPPAPLVPQPSHRKLVAVNAAVPNAFSADDSYRHGTHVAATVAGDSTANPANGSGAGHDHGDGVAPGARLVFEDLGSVRNSQCTTGLGINSIGDLLAQEHGAGARIASNSFGSGTGQYSGAAAEIDAETRALGDLLVVFSAGNDGPGRVTNIGSCKNCVTVGATENYDASFQDAFGILDPENMVVWSSRGTVDGRIKPDVVLPGDGVSSARFPVQYFSNAANPACSGPGDVCFPSFGGCYVTDVTQSCAVHPLSGTSMSTPAAAGLAALARQYFTDGFYPTGQAQPGDAHLPSAALLKAILINGARNLTGRIYERREPAADFGPLADAPSSVQGWGRIVLDDVLYFAGDASGLRILDVPDASGIETGDERRVQFAVAAPDQPLKVTLAWTDPAGQPFSGAALVDDLDLRLTAPDGTQFRGNQWTADDINVPGDKASAPNPAGRDALNNVEGIRIPTPVAGVYTVSVSGFNVPGDANSTRQGFGLVVTGALAGAAPPPVSYPGAGFAMTASRLNAAGTSIAVSWDAATCPAAEYRLLYGSLGSVASYALGGAVCDLGLTGDAAWSGVPSGNLWFVVVAGDGLGVEGTWGVNSAGSHRGGTTASGLCGSVARDNAGSCPVP
jgi:hypothetical protein